VHDSIAVRRLAPPDRTPRRSLQHRMKDIGEDARSRHVRQGVGENSSCHAGWWRWDCGKLVCRDIRIVLSRRRTSNLCSMKSRASRSSTVACRAEDGREAVRGLDQSHAEIMLPQAIDEMAGEERVIRGRQPLIKLLAGIARRQGARLAPARAQGTGARAALSKRIFGPVITQEKLREQTRFLPAF